MWKSNVQDSFNTTWLTKGGKKEKFILMKSRLLLMKVYWPSKVEILR